MLQFKIGDEFIYSGPNPGKHPLVYTVTRLDEEYYRVFCIVNGWETWHNPWNIRKLTPLEKVCR